MTRTIIEHDHYPDIVENGRGMQRLELLGLDEKLRDPHERRDFFANLSDKDFTRMIGYVNSITRGRSISYDYENGQLASGYTPPLEDKGRLMDLTAAAVREIGHDPALEDRTALRRMGLTTAGASNYVHPKENGNGRTGRLLHYLMEFGTERGDTVFEQETYALIGKLPIYDSDKKDAIDNTPPPALDHALDGHVKSTNLAHGLRMTGAELVSARVVAFLDMMSGHVAIPVMEQVRIASGNLSRGTLDCQYFEPGQIDGVTLYEKQYVASSMIPNRLADDVPEGAGRIMAQRATGYITIPIEYM